VTRIRQFRNQSRAIAAQAAVVLGQAVRATDAVARASPSDDDRDEASGELRSYMQMLLVSAPLLIDANPARTFLESAQRLGVQLARALRASRGEQAQAKAQLDDGVRQLRQAAAPLLEALNRDERAAVSSDEEDPSEG
jgi:hypothetical protein